MRVVLFWLIMSNLAIIQILVRLRMNRFAYVLTVLFSAAVCIFLVLTREGF